MNQMERPFDPDDEKYRCCCCHVMTGSKVLASLGIAGNILYVIVFIVIIAKSESEYRCDETWHIILIGCVVLSNPLNASLWYGLIKEREGYLIPTLAVMAVGLVLDIIQFFQVLTGNLNLSISHFMMSAFFYSISFGLLCWFYSIISSTYSYIKDKRAATVDIVVVQQMDHVYISVPNSDPAPLSNGDPAPPPDDDRAPPPYQDLTPPSYDDCINTR